MPRHATHEHSKAVVSYIGKDDDPIIQSRLLMERWQGVSVYIAKAFPHAKRVIWSCVERKWVYDLHAEIILGEE